MSGKSINDLYPKAFCKLSDIYNKFPDSLCLHSICKDGSLNKDISKLEPYIKINHFLNPRYFSYLIQINRPFEKFNFYGLILKDAEIYAARNGDGGYRNENMHSISESRQKIIDLIEQKIQIDDFTTNWSDLLISKPVATGFYYNKGNDIPLLNHNYLKESVEKIGIENVFEIRTDGTIFKAEWSGDKFRDVKPIANRDEIFEN